MVSRRWDRNAVRTAPGRSAPRIRPGRCTNSRDGRSSEASCSARWRSRDRASRTSTWRSPAGRWLPMSEAALVLRQVRYTNKAFWRNPASAFFTFVFPLMFLVIFTALLGSGEVDFGHGIVLDQATYFVAAMAAFGVITATYTNNAISVTFQRDQGILKRLRGTPLPSWAYLTARVLHSMLVALVLVVITLVFGKVAYGTD